MTVLIIIVHVLVSLIMIGVILLQAGKGAEIGAAFGGSSQTIFGSRGATTFLSKMTIVAATLFMLTSMSLSVLSKGRSVASSIVDSLPPTATTPAPAQTPASDGAAESAPPAAPGEPTAPATP
ncbi:MAG: preprotein translocase subunit SecG [Nitrospirota bacterium]